MSVRVMVPVEFVEMPVDCRAAVMTLNLEQVAPYSVNYLHEMFENALERRDENGYEEPTLKEETEIREWIACVRAIFDERGWGPDDPQNFFIDS